MNNETLNRLNASIADYKKESEEKDAIIKQQNQTLLRISAELEAIKQCDPFNSVFIAYSVENISNMIETLTETTIDEECIGCAGPCKVVDVAAKLQAELDATRNMYRASSDECCKQRKTIGDLRAELYDLKNSLPDNFWAIVTEKDDMIRRQGEIIEDFKTTIDDLESKLSEKPDTIGMLNYTTNIEKVVLESRADDNIIEELKGTIEDLKDRNIKDLKELYDLYEDELRGIKADRTSIKSDRDIMFQNYRNTVAKLQGDIGVLEAELSARKEDSEVLMKVVEIIKDDTIPNDKVPCIICNLVDAYLDAPEGPETPIDDLYKVTVSYAILEMP